MDDPTPFNIRVMDVDQFIQDRNLRPVTTAMIKEPSSTEFHPDGLFSEVIFGRVGTVDRLTTLGYIELNTTIIAPVVYQAIVKLGSLYGDIMAGRVYAIFNSTKQDFERVYGDPEDTDGADTGYNFFLSHFLDLRFKANQSSARSTRIQLVDTYRNICLYKRFLVQPAGLRDISNDATGKLIQDDVNKLYSTLIAYSFSIPPGNISPIYDTIRYNIQAKAVEIHEYLLNIMTGKHGFLQGSYAARRVALGTRNVLSAASYAAARPDDPQFLQPDETLVGLFQIMKAVQPLVYYGFKSLLINPIFGDAGTSYTIPLINPKTYQLEYHDIDEMERQKFTSSDGINGCINRFKNLDVRSKPITVRSTDKKFYYLMLVYDDQDKIMLFRSLDDLQKIIGKVDRRKVRPLTWIEAFYLITENAVVGKHGFLTRYPVLGDGSCYPSRIHLASTAPARIVALVDLLYPDMPVKVYPEYPILGKAYHDTLVPHSTKLAGLGADFDGDTSSYNVVLTDDSNEECADYLKSTKSLIDTQKRFVSGGMTDLCKLTLHNMSLMDAV